jgi:hypothetical protein
VGQSACHRGAHGGDRPSGGNHVESLVGGSHVVAGHLRRPAPAVVERPERDPGIGPAPGTRKPLIEHLLDAQLIRIRQRMAGRHDQDHRLDADHQAAQARLGWRLHAHADISALENRPARGRKLGALPLDPRVRPLEAQQVEQRAPPRHRQHVECDPESLHGAHPMRDPSRCELPRNHAPRGLRRPQQPPGLVGDLVGDEQFVAIRPMP